MRNTYLLIPDLPDTEQRPCTIEAEQVEYLEDHLGLTLNAWLEDKLIESHTH